MAEAAGRLCDDHANGWTPNREELAWAAGFFDGEGTTRSTDQGRGLDITVPNTNLKQLERFRAAVGGLGSIYGPRVLPNRKPIWSWTTRSFEKSQAAIAMLWMFLGDEKRQQARLAMEEYANAELARSRWGCKHGLSDTYFRPNGTRHTCRACRREKRAARG